MIRFGVQCLLALLMALGVALGGYSLWVSAAHAQSTDRTDTPTVAMQDPTPLPAPPEGDRKANPNPGDAPTRSDEPDPWATGSLTIAAPGASSLFAVVFHENLGTPIAQAPVTDGVAEFAAITPGKHPVRLATDPSRARRHYVASGTATVSAGELTRLNLDPTAVGDLSIDVRGGPPGHEWVRIARIERLDDPDWAPRTTDAAPPSLAVQGRTITVHGVPHGDYRVRLDHVATEQRVSVPTTGVTVIDVSGR